MIPAVRLEYGRYGDGEWLMRIAPDGGGDLPPILFLPPLFEEMNRTRALIAAIMRKLAARGHACVLPDLPGTGESERALEEILWTDWRAAAAAAVPHAVVVASIRGGCLLDDAAPARAHWRFAPVAGASLHRDLARAAVAGGAANAGYSASEKLLGALAAAEPAALAPLRTVRLFSDRGGADAKLEGPALWRRSEPGMSDELAELCACDIDDWARQCGAC